ncbi:hypothetical protein DP804_23265 [Salmonella enterica subsp. enterica]|nr:hypothetical protein [Salmonella enterica subsp. enterica serovar Virchow]
MTPDTDLHGSFPNFCKTALYILYCTIQYILIQAIHETIIRLRSALQADFQRVKLVCKGSAGLREGDPQKQQAAGALRCHASAEVGFDSAQVGGRTEIILC